MSFVVNKGLLKMKTISLIISLSILLLYAGNGYCDIAFVANLNGNWDLFIADNNGNNPIQLTKTGYDEKDPSWSYDKKEIIYATSDGHLNIINLETKESHQIAKTKLKTPKISPFFFPDGKEIVFAQFRLPEEGDDTDLMIYNLETKEIRRIIDQHAIQTWPVGRFGTLLDKLICRLNHEQVLGRLSNQYFKERPHILF